MKLLVLALPLLLTLALANALAEADADAQTSVQPSGGDIDFTVFPSFPSFRQCLKLIFAPYQGFGMTVPGELVGCITNECLCQPQNIAGNIPLLYTTAKKDCGNTKDAASATQILDGYCSDAGYTVREAVAQVTGAAGTAKPNAVPAATTATEEITKTLAGGFVVTETTIVVTENPPISNSPTSFDPNADKNSDLSVGSIVGIVVGVLGFIATSLGVWFGYKQYRNSHAAPVVTQPEQVGMMERGVVYGQAGGNLSGGVGYGYDNSGWNGYR